MCITVYVQSSNADICKAVQAHCLLLRTLSRSGEVKLVETAPGDDYVSITADSATTLYLNVTVSALLYHFQLLLADHSNCAAYPKGFDQRDGEALPPDAKFYFGQDRQLRPKALESKASGRD